MTYIFTETSTRTYGMYTKDELSHLANKSNWRIVELPNGYYQTEVRGLNDLNWYDVTRRESIEEAEAAIDSSVLHFGRKYTIFQEPKVVRTFTENYF